MVVPGRTGRPDRLVPRMAPGGRASVVYIASILNTPHPHPARTVDAARQALQRCIQHAGSAVKVCSHARMHAHPRAVRAGDPALWEKMRAGVAALVWARHGRGRCGVLHDKAHPCLAARQRPAGWHEGPDSTQAPHSSPNIVTPGPLLAAASESLLGTERSRRQAWTGLFSA